MAIQTAAQEKIGVSRTLVRRKAKRSVSAQPKKVVFDVEHFYKQMEFGLLPEDGATEIINGELIEKMPIGSRHATVVRKLTRYFERTAGDDEIVSAQNPIRLDKRNEPQPDLALLKWREDEYETSHPTPNDVLLLIEVSDTSLEYDKEIKLPLYAESGIPEVWLINLPENIVEVHSQPKKGFYGLTQNFGRGEIISSATTNVSLSADDVLGTRKNKKESK